MSYPGGAFSRLSALLNSAAEVWSVAVGQILRRRNGYLWLSGPDVFLGRRRAFLGEDLGLCGVFCVGTHY